MNHSRLGMSVPRLVVLLLWATSTPGAEPIVRQGAVCPPGYYRNGEYYTPARPDTQPAITRQGDVCPPHYSRNGDYCVPTRAGTDPPLTRQGPTCPPHYYRNGDYCVKNR